MTFLTAVRSMERWLALRALRTTVCLARFLADLMLATEGSWIRRLEAGSVKTGVEIWVEAWVQLERPEIMADSVA
jgi:hypothetical protein